MAKRFPTPAMKAAASGVGGAPAMRAGTPKRYPVVKNSGPADQTFNYRGGEWVPAPVRAGGDVFPASPRKKALAVPKPMRRTIRGAPSGYGGT